MTQDEELEFAEDTEDLEDLEDNESFEDLEADIEDYEDLEADFEDFEDAEAARRRRRARRRGAAPRRGARQRPYGRYTTPRGIRGGTAKTPNGPVEIKLPTKVATKDDVRQLIQQVQADAKKAAAAIAATRRRQDQMQRQMRTNAQLAAVASMIVPRPRLATLTLEGETVKSSTYHTDTLGMVAPLAISLLSNVGRPEAGDAKDGKAKGGNKTFGGLDNETLVAMAGLVLLSRNLSLGGK